MDTHFLAARQIVLCCAPESETARLAAKALPLPGYVVRRVDSAAKAVALVTQSKIEVLLLESDPAAVASGIADLRAADPDLEVLVVAAASQLELLLASDLPASVDVLGTPCSAGELSRRVELARERRYLRRGEQRRQRVEARMGAIMQAVPTGIISVDEEGAVHDWNAAATRIFGWSQVEALGRNLWEMAGIDPRTVRDAEGRLVLGRRLELSARHRNGRSFPADVSMVAVPLSERTMLCAIVEDRTETKRLELELRQAQKLEAVGQLSAGLAHELNTPCQFISDNVQFLRGALRDVIPVLRIYRDLAAAAEQGTVHPALLPRLRQAEVAADLAYCLSETPRSLAAIEQGAVRISGIVRAMKTFAHDEAGGREGPVDVTELAHNVLTVLSHQIGEVAELATDLQAVPPVTGHGGDLHQALFHIVRNAVDAVAAREGAPGKGKISVRSRSEGDQAVLTITDDGAGIPAAIRGRIFEPFFTTKAVGHGTGQGLAVAWSVIVDQHAGRLAFESVEGRGTTFEVRLPLAR